MTNNTDTPAAKRTNKAASSNQRPAKRTNRAETNNQRAIRTNQSAIKVTTVAAVTILTGFLILVLKPWLWVSDTTPTGGDIGAHVWAPAYLRDVLLSEWRLTGWSHGWYAGFPAFTFYMVIPSLLIVILDIGLALPPHVYAYIAVALVVMVVYKLFFFRKYQQSWVWDSLNAVAITAIVFKAIPLFYSNTFHNNTDNSNIALDRFLAALILPCIVGWLVWNSAKIRGLTAKAANLRLPICVAAVIATLLIVSVPYEVAFKLVAISGIILLPIAAYAMARLAKVSFPGPPLAATATILFLFDSSYNIYGGNVLSTMAGEFAYSLGLTCAVAYIGVAVAGMASGRHQVLGAILMALTGLTHLFPAFLALVVTFVILAMPSWKLTAVWARIRWAGTTCALAAALSCWWVLPFWWNRGMLNDMGWGKEQRYLSALWSRSSFDVDFLANQPPLQLFIVLALAGTVVAAIRRSRLPVILTLTAAIFAVVFVILPEGRLWNVRILPFYYLSVYLSALLGIAEMAIGLIPTSKLIKSKLSNKLKSAKRPNGNTKFSAETALSAGVALTVTAAVLVTVGMSLRVMPGGKLNEDGAFQWGPFKATYLTLGPSWLEYNYEGYELKNSTAYGGGANEYQQLMDTMADVSKKYGCKMSLWEYEFNRLGSYGTPMAPMLLPYWTDQCVGSMEGLYFEASGTTPYHFLMQSELSAQPSRAQRDLPYSQLDVSAGVAHMQLMGVGYYLAFSPDAVAQARSVPALTEIATSGPWVVFLVEDSDHVTALNEFPVVIEGLSESKDAWLELAVGAFLANSNSPSNSNNLANNSETGEHFMLFTNEGPEDWPRLDITEHENMLNKIRDNENQLGSPRERVMEHLSQLLPTITPRVPTITPQKAVSQQSTTDDLIIDDPVTVSDITLQPHNISFSVSQTHVPVLVRTSYFPNWTVSGAQGPYRVTPNLMVVIPTDTEVELFYSRSAVELFSMTVTLAGIIAAIWLAWRSRKPGEHPTNDEHSKSDQSPIKQSYNKAKK